MNKIVRLLIIAVAVGIVAAIITIIGIKSSLSKSGPIITRWHIPIRLPVVQYYKTVNNVLEEIKYKCSISGNKNNNIFIIIPLSVNYLSRTDLRKIFIKGLEYSINETSKVILIPYEVPINMTNPSKTDIENVKILIKIVKYCEEHGKENFLKLLNSTYKNITNIVTSKVSINITNSDIYKVFELSDKLVRESAINGLLVKNQYYLFRMGLMPIYIVCNDVHDVCVAATIDELSTVIFNVKTQIPYGAR